VAKTGYAARCAWTWAHAFPAGSFDHVLAYWGNHAATTAYLYHRLTNPRIPFSMLVQARMDLYRKPVFLAEKMAYADNIFIVCEFNRGYIRNRHHLGLDLPAIPFQPTPRPPATVIAVGRFEPLKGLDLLVRAAALLRDRGTAVRVVLVGGGDEEPALRGLAARLGLGDVVEFRGWLGSDRVFAAMREATVLAHPSIALDAMPTVLKEAIAVGTPVVASDLAGIPEILDRGRCGILVPPGDVAALAEGIGRLLADASLRQRLASAGREHAERLFDLWRNGRALADRLRATRRHGSAAT
jgi:glycosyltransferase involved in cell wall biosynthesis